MQKAPDPLGDDVRHLGEFGGSRGPHAAKPLERSIGANGEVLVALIDGLSATVNRLYREAHHLRLQPANAAMAPLRLAPKIVALIGVVVAVLREPPER